MSTTAITPSSSESSTSVLHWLPPVSALKSEKTVSRPVMDTLDEKPMTARLIVYRPVFEMMPARMLSTPRRVCKKAVMKPESIPAAMAAGSARSGCPAMVSIGAHGTAERKAAVGREVCNVQDRKADEQRQRDEAVNQADLKRGLQHCQHKRPSFGMSDISQNSAAWSSRARRCTCRQTPA